MTDSVEGGRRAGNEEHFIYCLEQEGECEELAAWDVSLSLLLSFSLCKVIKLYLGDFLQIRERKPLHLSAFLLCPGPRVRAWIDCKTLS